VSYLSQSVLGNLFGIASLRSVSDTIAAVASCLELQFVPGNLGLTHITREETLQNHSSEMYNRLFEEPDQSRVFLVLDGTYLYVEKSCDFEIQKKTYSSQKSRNLVKPFMIVLPDGYILEANGPWYADGRVDSNFLTSN
jgi:hypothetical protein